MQAGQFMCVELPHLNPDSKGIKRWFTNTAAPYENIMQITTRITASSFKQELMRLEAGSDSLIAIEKPSGDFIWQDSALPKLFIAGGIGITPYFSILKQRLHDKLPIEVMLIYSIRTKEAAFIGDFNEWQAAHPEFKVSYLIGERLDASKLNVLVPQINQSLVYITGPEPMVESLGDDFKLNGLNESQLKQDFFPNYNYQNY